MSYLVTNPEDRFSHDEAHILLMSSRKSINEPQPQCFFLVKKWQLSRLMAKPTKWLCTQRRLRSAWAFTQSDQSSLSAQWVAKDQSFLHADSEDSDQTGQMPRLIRVFAWRTCHFVGFVMRRLNHFQTLPSKEQCQVFIPHPASPDNVLCNKQKP